MRRQARRVCRQNFAVGQNAVQRRAQFMWQHQTDVIAQVGQLLFCFQSHSLHFFEPCLDCCVQRVNRERFRQVIIRA